MLKIGITGQSGFIGSHLFNRLKLQPELFEVVPFKKEYFAEDHLFKEFVSRCDCIVHLAGMNRYSDGDVLYNTNIALTKKLIQALKSAGVCPRIIFSSSVQEALDNPYGRSKLESRKTLEEWAKESSAAFSVLVLPNVFGEFCRPDYNSFIATFCYKLTHNEKPEIILDNEVKLIYACSVCKYIIDDILNSAKEISVKTIPHDFSMKVSEALAVFETWTEQYLRQGIIPALKNANEINLFNTYRSYIDINNYFPFKLKRNMDERGAFVETVKTGTGGQYSFSTTKAGITRGNHFHTRKIERFTVIKGKARIQMRRIGTSNVIEFKLDGTNPSHVDMPVWFTHNITNIGNDDLYTQFRVNEWYNADNPDTYFEKV